MRLLVTGGLGFIGSAVIRQAVGEGHDVLNLDAETYAGDHRTVREAADTNSYSFAHADIADLEAVTGAVTAFRPDAIINLAAETHVDRSIDGPAVFVRTNLVGTATLLMVANEWYQSRTAADQQAFRFVHVSTDEVFGSLGPNDEPFNPTTAYDPRSPYSASKAGSDHLARAWFHTYGLPVSITNCSNNYGAWQFPEKLIPLMTIKALRGEPLPVYGAGDNIRDWLHVEDHARGLLAVATSGDAGATYLFGGDAERKNLDIVHTVCDLVDSRAGELAMGPRRQLVEFVADRPGHDHRYAVDFSATTESLGWQPSLSFEEGLAQTVEWYLENEAFWEPILSGSYAGQRLGVTP